MGARGWFAVRQRVMGGGWAQRRVMGAAAVRRGDYDRTVWRTESVRISPKSGTCRA